MKCAKLRYGDDVRAKIALATLRAQDKADHNRAARVSVPQVQGLAPGQQGACDVTDPCEECGDPVLEDGCLCDGHAFCSACLHHCRQCLAAMREDWNLT